MALTQVSTGGIKDGQVQTADIANAQITAVKLHADALDHTYTLGADGSNHYTFTGEGLTGAVNDPTLYLTRGKTYRFVNGNSSGAHPFRIQSTTGTGGTEYNTGVTNNAGGGGTTIIFEVPHAAPDVLYYQCTAHSNMNGIFYVTGALADGTVTTAKLAADAVDGTKIADDAINSEHFVDGSIDTAHIADQAVDLTKLPHGTSSNDGKFLRANNGADPTFESLPASGVTVSNNADNRVVTGDGTNLNAESDLIYNGSQLLVNTSTTAAFSSRKLTVANTGSGDACAIEIRSATNGDGRLYFTDSTSSGNAGAYAGKVFYDHNDDHMGFYTGGSTSTPSEKVKIQANGNVDVVDGNLSFASGHGIDFSASSNESGSTTELLDDYERGSFTGAWRFDPTNATGVAYTYQGGMYVKIGRFVYFTLHMWTSNKGSLSSGSGWCQIEGLPFAVDGEGGWACISYYDNFGSFNPAIARVTPSERIYIAQHNNGGYSQDLQHSHMNNSSRMHIGGCYATTS